MTSRKVFSQPVMDQQSIIPMERLDGSLVLLADTVARQGKVLYPATGFLLFVQRPRRRLPASCFCSERVAQYVRAPSQSIAGVLYTDSQSLLDALAGSHPDSYDYHEEGVQAEEDEFLTSDEQVFLGELNSEWDLLHEIQLYYQDVFPYIQLRWVESHQDKNADYSDLSLDAQLNIDADRLAGEFQTEHGAARPYASLLPHAGVAFIISEATIASRYSEQIREAYSGSRLLKYLMHRNGWDARTMDDIDWKVHAAVLKGRCLLKPIMLNWFTGCYRQMPGSTDSIKVTELAPTACLLEKIGDIL